jgi:hypothetical protein
MVNFQTNISNDLQNGSTSVSDESKLKNMERPPTSEREKS